MNNDRLAVRIPAARVGAIPRLSTVRRSTLADQIPLEKRLARTLTPAPESASRPPAAPARRELTSFPPPAIPSASSEQRATSTGTHGGRPDAASWGDLYDDTIRWWRCPAGQHGLDGSMPGLRRRIHRAIAYGRLHVLRRGIQRAGCPRPQRRAGQVLLTARPA